MPWSSRQKHTLGCEATYDDYDDDIFSEILKLKDIAFPRNSKNSLIYFRQVFPV